MLRKISENATIAVIAPAYPPNPEKTEKGISYLQQRGFKIKPAASLQGHHGYFSAPDHVRSSEINNAFADPEVDAIICARGGWGGLRMLDALDYDLIAKNPKALVGYSDITTLQLAIWAQCKVPSLSGPMVAVEMGSGIPAFTEEHFWGLVNNTERFYTLDLKTTQTEIWKDGTAEGKLLGGCLSMIAHQLGTPYAPDFKDAILFIEDVGEVPYKIDRYLAQLKQASVLNAVKAVVVGEFLDCSAEAPSFTVEDVLHDYLDDLNCPVLYNFPYGHGLTKMTMPIGCVTKLDTETQKIAFENPFY